MIIGVFCLYLMIKNGTYFYTENFVGLLALTFVIFIMVYNWLSRATALFIAYVCAHSIYFLSYHSPFSNFGMAYDHYLQSTAAKGFIFLQLFAVLFVVPTRYYKVLRSSLGPIAIVSTISAFATYIVTGKATGIVGATSIDSALIACCLPYLWRVLKQCELPLRIIITALAVIAIFILGGSVALGCLVTIILFSVPVQNWRKYFILSVLSVMTLVATYYFMFDRALFNSSRRFFAYEISLKYFWENVNVWIGTGISTYWVYGPLIQDQNKWGKSEYFTFLHSDILQLLFEFGIVGIVLFLLMISGAISRIWQGKRYLLAPIMAYLVFMTFYYPLHSFLTAFVGAIIYRDTLERE